METGTPSFSQQTRVPATLTPYDVLSREALISLLFERDDDLDKLRQEVCSLAEIVKKQEALSHSLTDLIKEKDAEIDSLKEKLKAAQDRHFGVKSEKSARLKKKDPEEVPEEDRLFDEAGQSDVALDPAEEKSCDPQKASGGRRPLPDSLPQEAVSYDLCEAEKWCSCGSPLSRLGTKTFQTLEYVPAQVRVRTHHRLRYVCKACEETFRTASAPPRVLPKTFASPSLLAHILVSKFDDHLPLYRQAEIWDRLGIEMSRSTLSRWVIKCGNLLEPLATLMQEQMRQQSFLQGDETTLQVMGEVGRSNTSKSYMWCFKTGGTNCFDVVYHYAPSRAAQVAKDFLQGFQGTLQSDGYGVYRHLCQKTPGLEGAACWAHARRPFFELAKQTPPGGVSSQVVKKIDALYDLEREAQEKDLSGDALTKWRQEKSLPLLIDLKAFLEKYDKKAPPRSLLKKAIRYTLNQWDALTLYVKRAEVGLDNNAVERCIRPFAIGRKNWIFKGSVAGAKAGAVIYSLLESAKSYGHNPQHYFEDLLQKIPMLEDSKNISQFLPGNWKPPNSS